VSFPLLGFVLGNSGAGSEIGKAIRSKHLPREPHARGLQQRSLVSNSASSPSDVWFLVVNRNTEICTKSNVLYLRCKVNTLYIGYRAGCKT
jgi:hypothetical protein